MSLQRKILGQAFSDNALFVRVNSGQRISRLLFDCGEGTCNKLSVATLQNIDHLFFSHFHLDHIAGFDHFIRMNYNRVDKPVHIWGPLNTIDILFHRLNSFTWNLIGEVPTLWFIHEVNERQVRTVSLNAFEAFSYIHRENTYNFSNPILDTDDYLVSVKILQHRIPVLGFKVQEKSRLHINTEQLKLLQLPEGPYLAKLKDNSVADEETIKIKDKTFTIGILRERLLTKQKGQCLAYLTDFIFQKKELKNLGQWLENCDELICESQYLQSDLELAQQNFHLTTQQAAQIAKTAQVKKLTLIHFSRRYQKEDLTVFAEEGSKIFPNTYLPEDWIKQKL